MKLFIPIQTRYVASWLGLTLLVAPTLLSAQVLMMPGEAPTIPASTLRAHLEFLADDLLAGRDTGSDEYQIAALYSATQFASYGLEPGADGSFLQEVNYRTTTLDEESVTVTVQQGETITELTYKDDYLLGGDPTATETGVTAELVFIGFGIDAPEFGIQSFEGVDLEGKIAIGLTGSPETLTGNERAHYSGRTTKRLEVAKRGGVGLIWVPSRSDNERRPWERRVRWAGRPSLSWIGADGQSGGLPKGLRIAAYLSQEAVAPLFENTETDLESVLELAEEDPGSLESFDLGASLSVSFKSTHDTVSSPNVIARLPGSDPSLAHETVVYTAHLDHVGTRDNDQEDNIYNGAYDNAMGSAITLAVAEAMAGMDVAPRRTTLFILVGGEEKGLLGSRYFTEYPTVPLDSIIANVNIDMPLMLAPLDEVIAFGSEHSTLYGPVEKAGHANGFKLIPDPKPEQRLFVRSDQYSFVRRGIPSIYLVPGGHSSDPDVDGEALVEAFIEDHYHKPSDDLSQPIDWPTAERFSRMNLMIGLEVANSNERPEWNEGDFFGRTFGR